MSVWNSSIKYQQRSGIWGKDERGGPVIVTSCDSLGNHLASNASLIGRSCTKYVTFFKQWEEVETYAFQTIYESWIALVNKRQQKEVSKHYYGFFSMKRWCSCLFNKSSFFRSAHNTRSVDGTCILTIISSPCWWWTSCSIYLRGNLNFLLLDLWKESYKVSGYPQTQLSTCGILHLVGLERICHHILEAFSLTMKMLGAICSILFMEAVLNYFSTVSFDNLSEKISIGVHYYGCLLQRRQCLIPVIALGSWQFFKWQSPKFLTASPVDVSFVPLLDMRNWILSIPNETSNLQLSLEKGCSYAKQCTWIVWSNETTLRFLLIEDFFSATTMGYAGITKRLHCSFNGY